MVFPVLAESPLNNGHWSFGKPERGVLLGWPEGVISILSSGAESSVERPNGMIVKNNSATIMINVLEHPEKKIIHSIINFPNPFNVNEGPTTIQLILLRSSTITINIYDISGELVTEFKDIFRNIPPGEYDVEWHGQYLEKYPLANGVYICEVVAKDENGKQERRYRKIAIFSGR